MIIDGPHGIDFLNGFGILNSIGIRYELDFLYGK